MRPPPRAQETVMRQHEIAGVARCKLCGRAFAGSSGFIIGQDNNGRIQGYLQKLAGHLQEAHSEIMGAVALRALEFQGMLMLLNYSLSDPQLNKQRDQLRWQIHQQTLNARIPNEKLLEKSKHFAMSLTDTFLSVCTPEQQAALQNFIPQLRSEACELIKQLVTMLRDELEEPNKYPPNLIELPPEGPKRA